ncbi:MAG TPA: hypothetical protein VK204_02455 [Nocardioidaceae bacterium]|nr:hypothetical protein [Nocardioidaceae bacterium]
MADDSYVQKQATIAAIFNLVLNPVFAWLGNRNMDFVPVADMMASFATSSVILSLLVALFAASGVRRELKAGHDIRTAPHPHEASLLSRLPANGWVLGLLLGAGAAVIALFVLWLLGALGLSGMSFVAFATVLGLYAGSLGYLVARWVILRQLTAATLVP